MNHEDSRINSLNDRQQAYLLALYQLDQQAEAEQRLARLRSWQYRPASEWRWIEYGPRELPKLLNYDPPLRYKLKGQKLVDQGAGSTWNVLARRDLILTRYESIQIGPWRGQTLFVQLTRQGRALARQLVGGSKSPKKSDNLSIGAWRALALAYEKAPGQVWLPDAWHNYGLRLPELLILVGIGKGLIHRGLVAGGWDDFALTDEGKAFYERHYAHYHQLYPKVKAAEPGSAADQIDAST